MYKIVNVCVQECIFYIQHHVFSIFNIMFFSISNIVFSIFNIMCFLYSTACVFYIQHHVFSIIFSIMCFHIQQHVFSIFNIMCNAIVGNILCVVCSICVRPAKKQIDSLHLFVRKPRINSKND